MEEDREEEKGEKNRDEAAEIGNRGGFRTLLFKNAFKKNNNESEKIYLILHDSVRFAVVFRSAPVLPRIIP